MTAGDTGISRKEDLQGKEVGHFLGAHKAEKISEIVAYNRTILVRGTLKAKHLSSGLVGLGGWNRS